MSNDEDIQRVLQRATTPQQAAPSEDDRLALWQKYAVHGGPQGSFMLYHGFREAMRAHFTQHLVAKDNNDVMSKSRMKRLDAGKIKPCPQKPDFPHCEHCGSSAWMCSVCTPRQLNEETTK